MKKFLVLFFILFTAQIISQEYQDFKWLHEKPQGNTLRWVQMWDANNWYAVGYSGVFMKTTDAGLTWWFHQRAGRPRMDGSTSYLYDAHFFDMNNGIVGGTDGIMRTTDGGVTFDTVTANISPSGTIYQVFFLDNLIGYAAGSTVKLAKTTDGGLTWTQNATIPTGTCYDVWTPNDTLIIAASTSGNVRRSTDGGTTWTSVLTGASATLYMLKFSDPLNGWVAGSSSSARYTTDAGLTWNNANTGLPTGLTFYDLDIVPQASKLEEGFENASFPPNGWQSINVLGTAQWVRSTSQANSGAASAYISYQATGGEDWLITPKVSISADDDLYYFLRKYYTTSYPPDSIYIMVSTTDSALTSFVPIFGIDVNALTNSAWDSFMTDLSAYAGQSIFIAFKHIDLDGNGCFLDDVKIGPAVPVNEVWLTGDFADLWHTSNMGANWSSTNMAAPGQAWTSTHYATYFLNGSILSVGAFGLIDLKVGTSDPVTFTTFERAGTLYDVYGDQSGKIIAVGSPTSAGASYDQIMVSTDNGATWNFGITTDEPVNLSGPIEVEEQTEIIESKDNPLTPTSTSTFRSIQMFNQTTGYVVGSNGAVYKTTDGGLNWDSVVTPIPTAATLYKIDFVNNNVGWIFNNTTDAAGTIWKTTDGMATWTQHILTGQTGSNTRIYGADMLDENYGWCVSYKPRPYKTTDGGATWVEQPLSDAYGGFLYDIQMFDTLVGYCCGGGGRFYKTTDGGAMWNVTPTLAGTSSTSFYDLDFYDVNTGYLVGSSGVVLNTTDGGTTWTIEGTSGQNTNYGAYMVLPAEALDTASVLVVSSNAGIMKKYQFVVPVELTSFTAAVNGNTVTLNWGTATEVNNIGFDVERAVNNSWEKIGFVAGKGTTTELQSYSFTDKNLAAGKYNYRIKQIDFNGTYEYYNLSEVVEISVPAKFELSQNYPNPFNPSTTINYSLAKSGNVTLKIYNILGKEIATLFSGYQEAGRYTRLISVSELGSLSSGVYFYTLDAGSFKETRKMMILK